MILDPRQLHPKKGQPVLAWWRRVVGWAASLPVVVGPNVRITQTPLGTKVMVRSGAPVRTPFRVGTRGLEIRLSVGTVDGEVPWIALDRSGGNGNVRLDGTREEGTDPLPTSQVRYVLTAEDKPGEDGRSYVAVVAHLKRMREEGITSPGQSAATLRIEHRADLSPAAREAAREASGAVIHTLAVLYWSADRSRIERVGQVTHHHLQLFEDAEGLGFFGGV
jgi:hypothetical protein